VIILIDNILGFIRSYFELNKLEEYIERVGYYMGWCTIYGRCTIKVGIFGFNNIKKSIINKLKT
jgi:hypothetical protein